MIDKSPKKNTIQQLAEEAGVSIATASRAINNPESVKEETRQKVVAAAKKLKYRITSKSCRNILVIVSSLWNPFHSDLIKGISEEARKSDYVTYITQSNLWTQQEMLDTLLSSNQFSGIIYTHLGVQQEYLQTLQIKYPIVFCSQVFRSNLDIPYVTVNDYDATVKALKYLISTSRKRIAFANMATNDAMDDSFIFRRLNAYKDTMKSVFGAYDENLICSISDEINFEIAVPKLASFLEKTKPDALFCVSDIYACAALKAALSLGIKVPQELAIMGFDNLDISQMTTPCISTVSQPIYQMGAQGCRLLLDLIENKKILEKQIILNTELIIREST